MKGSKVISFLIAIILVLLLFMYSFFPFENIDFSIDNNPSFSLDSSPVKMQFYENMRFPEPEITYTLQRTCTLKKKQDMKEAFDIIENLTILEFTELYEGGQIFVACEEKNIVEEGMFIAGEGGPTKIISGDAFNVIFTGNIRLIRDSQCSKPNVAMHELLHVLGFNHSDNPQNLMYPISKCSQTIGNEIVEEINRLYSSPSYPDLFFENASGSKEGRYLNIEISVRNGGLKTSSNSKVVIYSEEKVLKQVELKGMDVGMGITVNMKNIDVGLNRFDKIKIKIENGFDELSKENNEIILNSI